ncbi:MAG: hypothetical protein AcusKO_22590 [Acuticoccus sp.]
MDVNTPTRGRPMSPNGWTLRAALGLAALCLAGCGGGSGEATKTAATQFFQAGVEPEVIDPQLLAGPITCPKIEVQQGAQALRRTSGDAGSGTLRWQASITRTARECSKTGEGTLVRVGVSGRVVEGAAGGPSRVELPLRVAVREGGETTYSKTHKIAVDRTGASQDWAFVDEGVVVKDAASARIFVGFDS